MLCCNVIQFLVANKCYYNIIVNQRWVKRYFFPKGLNETGFEPRDSHIYYLFSISVMLMIEMILKMSHISKSCYFPYQYTLSCK